MTLALPFVADCTIAGKRYNNLEVVKMNENSVHVRLPNGDIVKRNFRKHSIDVKFVRVE
jgi:hypothetical protein